MSHDNLTNVSPLSISATPYYIIGHSLLYKERIHLIIYKEQGKISDEKNASGHQRTA